MTNNPPLFRINGRVIDNTTRRGIPNLRVEAWDKDLIINDFVGSDRTDAEGRFFIEFTSEVFRGFFFDREPDLFFRVFSDTELIADTRDKVMWNVPAGDIPVEIPVSLVKTEPPVTPPDEIDQNTPDYGPTKSLANLFGHAKLAKALREEIAKQFGKETLEPRDLVTLGAKDWETLIKDHSVPLPENVTREDYAARIAKQISNWYPTAALFHRLKPVPAGEVSSRIEELQPLLPGKENAFKTPDFGRLESEGVDTQALNSLKSAHNALFLLGNRYPGLKLEIVLDDSKTSSSEKAAKITQHIGWVEKFRETNLDTELLALDYTPDSADQGKLKFDGLPPEARQPVLATVKAYQRAFALTSDTDHAATLLDAGYKSAANIVRDRLEGFVKKTGLPEADARKLFAAAEATATASSLTFATVVEAYAGQFDLLKVSNNSPAIEDHLKKLDGFADFFGSQSACQCEHCQSILSPAAYFVDLMCFVEDCILTNHFTGGLADDPLSLKKRRSDLWTLELTCENTNKEIPTLDVINEILEKNIAGAASDPETVERTVYEETLSSGANVRSFRQPFSLPLKQLDSYLRHFERTRASVSRTIDADAAHITRAQLRLSEEEYDLIVTAKTQIGFLRSLYGIEFGVANGIVKEFDAHSLLEPMGISRPELGDLMATEFVKQGNQALTLQAEKTNPQSVQNDIERIHNLPRAGLDKMHRFVRLWRQLQWRRRGEKEDQKWTIAELDLVLRRLNNKIDARALEHIATLLFLQERFGASVEELRAIWSEIPGISIIKGRPSLFDRLFNLPSFVKLDGAFPKNARKFIHPSLRQAPLPVDNALLRLLGGLRVSDEGLYLLITNLSGALGVNVAAANDEERGFKLSKPNLSILYRHARLAEWFNISIAELFQLISLIGLPNKYVANLSDVIALLDLHDWWKTTHYTLNDLSFITGGGVTDASQYPNVDKITSEIVKEVMDEKALVFADTLFATEKGITGKAITEKESREILRINPASFVAVVGGGYRLKTRFDPEALELPEHATLTKDEIWSVLKKYHASKIIPARVAGKLGLSVEKLSALLELSRADLSRRQLMRALLGGSPTSLARLIRNVLPLHVLFRNQVFDQDALKFVKDIKEIFGIEDFSKIKFTSIRTISIYKSFVDSREAEKFSLAAPQTTSTEVQEVIKTFTPGSGFNVNQADPQTRLNEVTKLARVIRTEPGLAATLHGHLSLPPTALEALQKLYQCAELARYLGVSGETLKLIVSGKYAELAQASDSILSAFRAKYGDEKEWETKVAPYEDMIRSGKRAALVDYLIHDKPEYKTSNDLFSDLLIDVQLEGCARTSRVVAAISSLQLYVHRVLMNLEQDRRNLDDPKRTFVQLDKKYQDEWSWRKNYRVWEANRKVFLYPENYIEPELRDDKTPLFEELESTLLQQEINEQTVLDAYAKYMSGFEEVAQLKIAGSYHDRGPNSDVLHLFGVTPSAPPIFYYRTVENIYHSQKANENDLGMVWNPWRKIDLQIPVRKVSPVVFGGKLYVFWVEFVTTPTTQLLNGESIFNGYRHKMSLKFTSLRLDGAWTAPQPIGLPATRASEEAPEGQRIRESYWFPFRGDAAVIPDPRFDADQRGARRAAPRYASDNIRHIEAKEEYTLSGFLWDRVYPSAFRNELNIVGANHSLRHSVDFYRRTLLETNARYRQVTEGARAVYGTPSGSFRELYRGVFTGDSPITAYNFGSSSQVFGYGFSSLILDSERLDEWGRLRFGDEDTTSYRVSRWLGIIRIARLPLESTLEALNSSEPISDFLIDSQGDLFLLQGNVRDLPQFLLRRIGTTLGEAVGEALSFGGVDGLLSIDQQQALTEAAIPFTDLVDIEDLTKIDGIDFTGPYGVYYREIFFHIPFLIANHLNAKQRFAASQRWYHFIFNPTAAENIPEGLDAQELDQAQRDRNWRYLEFRNQTLPKLRNMLTGDEAKAAIEVYKKDPFNPHAIARLRISAYQKSIVMKYIDNLLDWGDSLFAQFTRESINEAMLLYVMAQDILGERPVELGECGEGGVTPKSFSKIGPLIREGSEFLAEVESYYWSASPQVKSISKNERDVRSEVAKTEQAWQAAAKGESPLDHQSRGGRFDPYGWKKTYTSSWQSVRPNTWGRNDVSKTSDNGSPLIGDFRRSRGFTWSLVRQQGPLFCVPANKELRSYWGRVEDRLYKIRNCRDISGMRRELALFAPEIDPRLLVKAKAAGLTLEDVLNAISGNLPPYRFTYLIEKAKSYAGTVQGFGNALLSALEKKDVEELTRLRTVHEQNILKLTTQIRQWEIDTITEEIDSIEKRKSMIEYRKGYYESLVDISLTPWERTQQISHHTSSGLMILGSLLDGSAGVLSLIPQLGAPTSLHYGGKQLSDSAKAWGAMFKDTAGLAQIIAGSAGLEAGFQRREQDWQHQSKLAGRELAEIEKQLAVAKLRKQVTEEALANHKKSVEQQEEIFDFYGNKFSNLGLYTWLSTTLQRLHREAYNSAFGMARLAEQAFKFERGEDDSVSIASDYWDASKAGLLAGDRLLLGLQNLERRFIEANYRNLEVTQSFSLAQIDPLELIKLRETGTCKIEIPELFMDLTYPGHYRRLIKAVRLTIPCITGPYANVGATLTLTKSEVRMNAETGAPRVPMPPRRSVSIATSNAQSDPGVFEFNFRDERYMPFEGAGAISTWALALPSTFRQFDYQTISDVVLHVSYTAEHDEDEFRRTIEAQNLSLISTTTSMKRVLSFRQDFPSAFQRLIHSPADTEVKIEVSDRHFPFFLRKRELKLEAAKLAFRTIPSQTLNNVLIQIHDSPVPPVGQAFVPDPNLGDLAFLNITDALAGKLVGEHVFKVKNGGDLSPTAPLPANPPAIDAEKVLDVVLYLEYKVKAAP